MRFKHSLLVFIDNIATTYKLLLYRIIVVAIVCALSLAVIIPSLNVVQSTAEYGVLSTELKAFFADISALKLTDLEASLTSIKAAMGDFMRMLTSNGLIAVDVICAIIILFIYYFLCAVGDFGLGETLNNRMMLRAHTPYAATLLKDLRRACLYAVIYTPVSLLFYAIGGVLIWAIAFKALAFAPLLLRLFIASAMIILIFALKFSLTTDWMPHILHSNCNNRKAMSYCLHPKKGAFLRVLSTLIFMVIVIFVLNAICGLLTFGAALIITVPAGTMLLTCYQFVNYCDNNSLKFFIDDYVIIGPQKDAKMTTEQFFKDER
ncbi:MAG: hypothetical protein ACI4QN_01485 [Candidatus Coproplasma sp.]